MKSTESSLGVCFFEVLLIVYMCVDTEGIYHTCSRPNTVLTGYGTVVYDG